MNPLIGSAAAARMPSVTSAPRRPTKAPFEHEGPADERIRRADQPHDLDLLRPRDDGQPDRVDDDEQHDHRDDDEDDRPGCAEDIRDRRQLVDELLLLLDLLDDRFSPKLVHDVAEDARILQLDLEARVQRVRIEVAGQVLFALLREPGAESLRALRPS